MSTTVIPSPAGEAAAAGEQSPKVTATPGVSAIQAAADAGRALLKAEEDKRAAAIAPVVPVAEPVETPEEITARETAEAEEAALVANETPEQTAERHAAAEAAVAETPAGEPIVVKVPGVRAEDPDFELEVSDQEAVEAINRLKKGYARREQAEEMYDKAQQLRDQTEDIRYAAELDPGGIVLESMQNGEDVTHLFRFLATRKGVLEQNREWLSTLIEEPDAVATQAAALDAERITRRDSVRGEIQEKMQFDENARAVLKSLRKSITSLAPDSFNEDSQALLERDVRRDMLEFVNWQIQQYREQNPNRAVPLEVRMLDPRRVPGLIQRRFALMGVAPKAAKPTGEVPASPVAGTKPAAGKVPLSPAALKTARSARFAAASAPPGAGSPVAALGKAPAYDPKVKGTPIQQAANWWKERLAGLSKTPQ